MPVCFAFRSFFRPFVFSSVLSFAFDRLTFPFFVQFPICPFIYLVIRLLFVRRFIHFPACLHCVNLSVFSFVLINSVIHPLIRSISHPFFHLFGHSCTHCLSSLPMVIVSVGFVYPIVPSPILSVIRRPIGPFTRRNCNSFYFRACIVMFADTTCC